MSYNVNTGYYFTNTRHSDTYPAINPSKRDYSGRYVFVTGASKGIGYEIALSFASAGVAGIGIGARSGLKHLLEPIAAAAKAAGKLAPQVVPVQIDVTDEQSVKIAAEKIDMEFPRLDVLVNNAGYLEPRALVIDSDPGEWWASFEVNVKRTYLVSRSFAPLLLKTPGDKVIVNLSSVAAHLVQSAASSYQTSKLAVQRLTEFLDTEYGPNTDKGIVAFGIHPGGVLTDMGKKMPKERQHVLTETPKLPADTIVFLAEKSRPWLSGRYVSATWDVDELLAKEDEIVKNDKLKVRLAL